ncbi:pilus assembly protein TadG-related protein [uncultured Amphritea sp.]|uniref:pilus assembly protein TadG-related protein n=1 Tax=Amphritea sp. TaxID=1872502 RepID=UPI0025DCC176|nr:pilus assembly protein TadG-related protein [uncultured Amphritea sp.]
MKTYKSCGKGSLPSQQTQKGVIAVVVAIGIAALVGIVGLALDTGHLLLNKTRLQNAVDAAALTGAQALQYSVSATPMEDARNAAIAAFTANLSSELNSDSPVPTVTFSEDLMPGSFVAATANPPQYIKVSSPVIPLTSFLIKAVGFDDKKVAAVAVAGFGFAANACDLIPVMVCKGEQDPDSVTGYKEFEFDKGRGAEFDAAADTVTLKTGSGSGPDEDVGTGSFHLIDIPGLQGANDIRYAFAEAPSCGEQGENFVIDLSPGNKVGPTVSGLNTRFGLYSGPLQGQEELYPPDYANDVSGSSPECIGSGGVPDGSGSTACLDPRNYAHYYNNPANALVQSNHKYQRRVVKVPVGNCDGTATGNDTIETLGFGCFLLTAPAEQTGGTETESGSLQGVFLNECTPPATGITEGGGATRIVLYRNPDGNDS